MRSFQALALGLTLIDISAARVTTAPAQQRDTTGNALVNWLGRLLRKDVAERAVLDTCAIDAFYNFAADPKVGKSLCQALLQYPNETEVVDYTPVSTSTNTISTRISTIVTTIRSTPVVTVTEGSPANGKRDVNNPEITNFPRAAKNAAVADAFEGFRRLVAANSSSVPGDAQMSASFSSACACQTYGGSTVTSTYTDAPSIATQNAIYVGTTTVSTVRTAAPSTTTVTPGASNSPLSNSPPAPTAESSSTAIVVTASIASSSAAPAVPTSPPFSCPEDNNTIVNQMVGTMRYDYLIRCDTDLSDADIYTFSYATFGECASACSITNTRLGAVVCDGVAYYETGGVDGSNCFLKATTGGPHSVPGIDSALLQRIAVGSSPENPAGTTTESLPLFGAATQDPSDLSSQISTAMANSSNTIATTRPPGQGNVPRSGLLVNAGGAGGLITSYSTTVIDGSTVSTGTGYSTYYSSDGTWYYSYYTAWSEAWSSATTVYGASESGMSISNSTDSSSSSETNGGNGDYSTITTTNTTQYYGNGDTSVTQVISNVTYNSAGSQIASTATTNFYSYSTGGASGGGAGGSGAGPITSSSPVALMTPAPSVIINTYGTAYSTGYVVSGGGGGNGGGIGGQGSGALTPISSTVNSGVISGASGFAASGALTPISSTVNSGVISGASGFAASGALTPISSTVVSTGISGAASGAGSGAFIPISSTINSGIISGASGFVASGAITPISSTVVSTETSGSTGGFGSGVIPSAGLPFTNSGANRSGGPLTSPSSTLVVTGISGGSSTGAFGIGLPLGSGTAPALSPISSTKVVGSTGGFSGTAASGGLPSTPLPTGAIPSAGLPFTNSQAPRSGTESTTLPLGTGSPVPFPQISNSKYYGPIIPASGTAPLAVTPPAGTAATSTPGLFTNSNDLRSGASLTFPTGTGFQYGPGPSPFTNSGLPRSGSPLSSGTLPLFTGPGTAPIFTGPAYTAPLGTGPIGTGPFGTAPLVTGPLVTAPAGTAPVGTAPAGTGTAPLPFTNSELPRSGSAPSSGFLMPTAPLGTGSPATSPSPTAPASCVTNYLGTTTIFTTVTEFGCYSNCPPAQNGYGNSPNTFGPPVAGGNGPY